MLITLEEAKAHLNITHDTDDVDVASKAQMASDIVVAYLKGRPISVTSINASGGTATVVTSNVHGLVTGDTVFIRGAVQPEYNGEFTVTVVDTSSFTYAISGTPVSPATGMLWIRAAQAWTDATVPSNVKAAILLMLTHLYLNRGEDMKADESAWKAIGNLLVGFRDPALA